MFSEGAGCQPCPGFASSIVSAVRRAPPNGVPPMIVTLLDPAGGPAPAPRRSRDGIGEVGEILPAEGVARRRADLVEDQLSVGTGPATSVRPLGIRKLRG